MASNNTLVYFSALNAEYPSTNNAVFGNAGDHPVIEFDPDTIQYINFFGYIPRSYLGGGITLVIHFVMATATTGTVVWQAAFEKINDGILDIDVSPGFASVKSATSSTVPGIAGLVSSTSIAFSNSEIDGLAAGDPFRLQISREATNAGSDTAAGFARLRGVELRET